MVFWSKAFGWSDQSMDPVLEDNLIQQIEDINENFEHSPITEAKYFCKSSFWKPAPLRKLEDFFFDLDRTKPNLFDSWKRQ